ncbi:MAG: hypothetical protein HDS12_00250 [Bacteroides sp.]|nr:hypothetical protein [Bacteroides sp.]MBD5348108.1 hypothetical protein [Bacteroides sp.]
MTYTFKKFSHSYISLIMFLLFSVTGILSSNAQIGYQVALINNATGEPRALETVNVSLSITNSEGKTIYSGAQSATTNDFGILSLSVGDANTFKNVDWTKLPFFISAEVDGILIGKTQILSVPVAEHANHIGHLTPEKLNGKTYSIQFSRESSVVYVSYTFNSNGSGHYSYRFIGNKGELWEESDFSFNWYINADTVCIVNGSDGDFLIYIPEIDKFICIILGERKVLS